MKSVIKSSILTLLSLTVLFSQTNEYKLTPADGDAGDNFGIAVDISPDFAVISAYWDDDLGESAGAAYIYIRSGDDWSFQQKLTADDGAPGAYFGSSVAIDRHTVIIGAPRDNATDIGSGSAYIFHYDSVLHNWSQIKKLVPQSDTSAYNAFGTAVAIAGSDIAIGAIGEHNYTGTVYLYYWDGAQFSLQHQIMAQDPTANASFGFSLAMASSRLLVGAPFGSDGGAVYYFEAEDTSWVEKAQLTATSEAQNPAFGYALALLDTYALIGASGDRNDLIASGAAYMFQQEGADWRQLAKLADAAGFDGEEFGFSVALSPDFALVGARQDDDNGGSSGSVFVFKRDGNDWYEQTKLLPGDGSAGDMFGYALAMENETVIAGAPGNSGSGAAYIYTNWLATALSRLTAAVPDRLVLQQNFPNPFNPITNIEYQISNNEFVMLEIYNLLGQKVATLVSGIQPAGQHQVHWDASSASGGQVLTSGIYICRLRAGSEVASRKMILLR